MRVRMKQHITGSRNGVEWPLAGGEIDLPDHEANDLIAQRYAEPVADDEITDADLDAVEPAEVPAPADAVPAGTARAVLGWVDNDPDRAAVALGLERDGKNRTRLVGQLEAIIDQGGADASTTEDPGAGERATAGPDGEATGDADTTAAGQQDAAGAGDEAASRDW